MNDIFEISREGLIIRLCAPMTYYQGTRFDAAGAFRSIEMDGVNFADEWFDHSDPFRHDRICGASEEFDPIWLPDGKCLKIGVGILDTDEATYDRFKLYPILEMGNRTLDILSDKAVFTHEIGGQYKYIKTIAVLSPNEFEIRHELHAIAPQEIRTLCYNHNFFTFGRNSVDADRSLEFASPIVGNWRPDSLHTKVDGCTIRLDGRMMPGEKAFMGDISCPEYDIKIVDGRKGVHITCPAAVHHTVFWSNDRVACAEPYVEVNAQANENACWTINYKLWK